MSSTRKIPNWVIWTIVVVVILIIIIAYIASLGTVNLTNKEDLPTEFRDSREQALLRHKALKKELDQKLALREKLNKRFKAVYAIVRFALVALWLGPLYLLYRYEIISEVGDALNYSEASFFIILILNFITFGNLTNLSEFLTVLKARVENWVWAKNLNLTDDILANSRELENVTLSLSSVPTSQQALETNTIH
jgi:hypothetical protein